MTKQHFVALADSIRAHNSALAHISGQAADTFTASQIAALADFCKAQNPAFKRDRWLSYIAGQCGPNGGAIKPAKN